MKVVGSSVQRSDGEAKVRGDAVFGADLAVPGMLHARLLRAPVAAGIIRHIDTAAAKASAGVRDVVTGADVLNERAGVAVFDNPLFATDYIAYEGEPIAAVVADTAEQAEAAIRKVELTIDAETPVATPGQALMSDARMVHPSWAEFGTVGGIDFNRDGNIVSQILLDPGDVDGAFKRADRVIEGVYQTPRQYQAYLEPKMALATFEAGRYTIQVSHQYPFRLRDRLAQVLDVPKSAVRIVGHHIGGGFGAKLDLALEPYAAVLARRARRPVMMLNNPEEERLTAPCRENATVKVRSAVLNDGTILAQDVDVVFDSGAYANNHPATASIPIFMFGSIYRVGTARIRNRMVYTNTAPTGAFRGVSGPYLVFAAERHMDQIANELGRDRREYRLAMLAEDGHKMLNGQALEELSILHKAFDLVEERAPWAEQGKGKLRGVGIAAAVWLTNPQPGQATVKLNEDGTLTVVTAATDSGSGAVTTGLRQIAAECLGISADAVTITMPDTDVAGFDAGSQGSRTTHVAGRAVYDATTGVREKVIEKAAAMLETAKEDLVIEDGVVHVAGVPEMSLGLADVAMAATFSQGPIAASGSYTTPPPPHDPSRTKGMLFSTWPTPTYHVHLAEVTVDAVTGKVTVERYIIAQEVGRTINPDAVKGQVLGGLAQGLGYTLWERVDIDAGRYVQRNFESHGLPLACDMPEVEFVLMENPEAAGPYGAKGAAEPSIVPVAAVIANAVSDAIGAPIDDIPITPEAVLDALERS
ncbi:MAG: xanthine dehydrogenase family protein molybdopterin-binding subunit [Rhodospirillaceae bacterium]|nr:xanthine dehydrogenase family protein molybdopterin-binding subunit [Rhodospirillaceae bacterium]MBT5895025.1 xanthine dehydrogenase family protein molybdopterin-binding subunit [Rhodospirillaceae bacterium]MBT6430580.1 xanthine dehydrogenase family protein molybdopterin-binding subunit [Rhodospirillaceae bacterium]